MQPVNTPKPKDITVAFADGPHIVPAWLVEIVGVEQFSDTQFLQRLSTGTHTQFVSKVMREITRNELNDLQKEITSAHLQGLQESLNLQAAALSTARPRRRFGL